jgi:hypothetical protein
VLLIECEGVADNAHEVMNEVTIVEEAVVLHEDGVPDEVSEGVGEDDQLKVGRALGACYITVSKVPVERERPGDSSVVHAYETMADDELVVWFTLCCVLLWEGVKVADDKEHKDP